MWSINADDPIAAARAWTANIRAMAARGEPSGMVHSLLAHHAADIETAIGEASSASEKAGLRRAEAEVLATAGKVSFYDMGQYGAAEREFKSAMRCARHSDDLRLCGWVFTRLSNLETHRHSYGNAVLAADAAMDYTHANPLLTANVYKMRADAHALDGNMVGALRDIDNARDMLRAPDADEVPSWLSHFDTTVRVDAAEGVVWLRLGQPRNAVEPLQRALRAIGGHRNHAVVLCADLATALGRIGAPDEAVHVLLPALPIAANSHSVERRARLQTAWRAVEPSNTSATRALRDQLRAYHLLAA